MSSCCCSLSRAGRGLKYYRERPGAVLYRDRGRPGAVLNRYRGRPGAVLNCYRGRPGAFKTFNTAGGRPPSTTYCSRGRSFLRALQCFKCQVLCSPVANYARRVQCLPVARAAGVAYTRKGSHVGYSDDSDSVGSYVPRLDVGYGTDDSDGSDDGPVVPAIPFSSRCL